MVKQSEPLARVTVQIKIGGLRLVDETLKADVDLCQMWSDVSHMTVLLSQ